MWFIAQAQPGGGRIAATGQPGPENRPAQAAAFAAFAPQVRVRWDQRWLFVESNGLPAHNMMVGITAWQQQVPLPQNYTGANAWQIPLAPVPATRRRAMAAAVRAPQPRRAKPPPPSAWTR